MADSAEPRRGQKILVVEDEPLIRMIAVEMLDLLGHEVLEACNGAEALALAADPGGIYALMIDLGLPDRSGEEVIRLISQSHPGLPVIVTTGSDTAAAAHRLDGLGIVAFLEKPYNFKDLELAIAPLARAG
jgi:CheY-like chemotaxis protein